MRQLIRNRLTLASILILLITGTCTTTFAQAKRFKPYIYYVNKIYIQGNRKISQSEIRKQLFLKEKKLTKKTTFTRRLLQLDKLKMETLYVKKGYLRCTVTDSFSVSSEGGVNVYFNVNEGEQYYLDEITITGQETLSEKQIRELLHHKVNKPYNPLIIRSGMKSIITEYANMGKPTAIIDDSLNVNSGIHLFIKIYEGETMKIGEIKVTNNDKVSDEVIEREVILKEGDLFSHEEIERSKKRLYETGLFSSADIEYGAIDTAKKMLSLIVNVRELDMRYIGLDFGFGQNRGISEGSEPYTTVDISGEWLHRNALRRGGRFSTKWSNSLNLKNILIRPKTTAEVLYIEPWFFKFRISTSLRLFVDNEIQRLSGDEQEVTRFGGEAAFIYKPDERIYFRTGLEIKGIRSISELPVNEEFRRARERAINLSLNRDYRDDFLYPTRGTLLTINGKLVGSILGGTEDYYKAEISFSQYKKLFGPFVLAYRGKFGWMDTFFSDSDIPFYEKFYLGGETSLRGWLDRRFPVAGDDPLSGGNIKVLTNAEIRFPLFWLLGVETFIDGGTLAYDIKSLQSAPYRWDGGIGLTIATPLGPIRIDYARVLNPLKGEKRDWQIQLAIPYAF